MELLYSNRDYSAAIPLLVKAPSWQAARARGGGVDCLCGPDSTSVQAFSRLVGPDRGNPEGIAPDYHGICSATDGLADAISRLAGQEYADVFRDILRDQRMGPSRCFLVGSRVIIKSQRPDTCDFLTGLLNDGDIQFLLCLMGAIVKRRCPTALDVVTRLSSHPDREVAKQANAAVRKLSEKK